MSGHLRIQHRVSAGRLCHSASPGAFAHDFLFRTSIDEALHVAGAQPLALVLGKKTGAGEKEKIMGAILELTSYAATPVGMIAIIAIGAAAYFAARWVLAD